ncbi:jmjC domain-containing protein 7 isoform X2 [Selaginella moellendorffii]|uniref:jmjC domain-containing protein 7 isoform X2 n=1 Tax=Selaginella moellendorffii TaxID=88036 RepID=UPI000D1CACF8|nr:jmjC domain-containing protein 7 isoform X2 [Selaginella moellendorffii]|eukprot:XP_024525057.1 jmjC domain-containing protein 7 isoform X2 [Selaginella moellendorffii]
MMALVRQRYEVAHFPGHGAHTFYLWRVLARILGSGSGAMEEAMELLSREARELSLGSQVERVAAPVSPLRFLRDFVMPGKPCIVTGGIQHWSALRKWSNDYLRAALGDQQVSVHFTPDGRADSIVDVRGMEMLPDADGGGDGDLDPIDGDQETLMFVSAHVQSMPFAQALEAVLGKRSSSNVAYLQQQNDCLRTEYSRLIDDVEADIPWATQALGSLPEAVNLWIGNENSVTSFHKDHYENLYAVVAGEKHFTLLPPVDVHRLYIRDYPAASYVPSPEDERKLVMRSDRPRRMVPWASVDPECRHQDKHKFPRYFSSGGGEPFHCTVGAGEILYLPSMWFHHVTQRPDSGGRTIAINFWYDMAFDIRYAYFNFLESCVNKKKNTTIE